MTVSYGARRNGVGLCSQPAAAAPRHRPGCPTRPPPACPARSSTDAGPRYPPRVPAPRRPATYGSEKWTSCVRSGWIGQRGNGRVDAVRSDRIDQFVEAERDDLGPDPQSLPERAARGRRRGRRPAPIASTISKGGKLGSMPTRHAPARLDVAERVGPVAQERESRDRKDGQREQRERARALSCGRRAGAALTRAWGRASLPAPRSSPARSAAAPHRSASAGNRRRQRCNNPGRCGRRGGSGTPRSTPRPPRASRAAPSRRRRRCIATRWRGPHGLGPARMVVPAAFGDHHVLGGVAVAHHDVAQQLDAAEVDRVRAGGSSAANVQP